MLLNKILGLRQIISGCAFGLGAIAVIGLQFNRYQKVSEAIDNPDHLQQEQDTLAVLKLRKMAPNFGFNNLIADLTYLEFIQYFGNKSARQVTGYSLAPDYFQIIADQDPQFTDAYLTLSTANSVYAGKPQVTVYFMNQILNADSFPTKNSHLMWTVKAIDESIFLGDLPAAKHSYEKAADSVLQQDISSRNQQYDLDTLKSASIIRQKAEFLATKPNPTQTQIFAWQSVLPNVVKESEKQEIRDRIKSLEAKLAE